MIHHWLGWISLAVCALLLAKYIGRISKNKTINQFLRKLHKPLGLAVIGISALHGIICFVRKPQFTIQNVTGILLFVLIIALALTFYARARLKAKWFKLHRIVAVVLVILMIIHVAVSFNTGMVREQKRYRKHSPYRTSCEMI